MTLRRDLLPVTIGGLAGMYAYEHIFRDHVPFDKDIATQRDFGLVVGFTLGAIFLFAILYGIYTNRR